MNIMDCAAQNFSNVKGDAPKISQKQTISVWKNTLVKRNYNRDVLPNQIWFLIGTSSERVVPLFLFANSGR